MSSINNISTSLPQLISQQVRLDAGLSPGKNISDKPITDATQVSPLSQLLNTLQQLQTSNPTEFASVTKQIATNLATASQTAQQQGNTQAANTLQQLSTVFTYASQSGETPDASALSQAAGIGGGGGHHHHHGPPPSSSSSTSSDATTTTTSAASTTSTSQTTNPLAIIYNTLVSAGVLSSGSVS